MSENFSVSHNPLYTPSADANSSSLYQAGSTESKQDELTQLFTEQKKKDTETPPPSPSLTSKKIDKKDPLSGKESRLDKIIVKIVEIGFKILLTTGYKQLRYNPQNNPQTQTAKEPLLEDKDIELGITKQRRMVGNLNLNEEFVKKYLQILSSSSKGLTAEDLSTAFGLKLNPAQAKKLAELATKGDVDEISKFIVSCKEEGLFYTESLSVLKNVIQSVLKSTKNQDPQNLLQPLHKQIENDYQKFAALRLITLHSTSMPRWLHDKIAKHVVNQFMQDISKLGDHDPLGKIIQTGWPGHAVGLQVVKEGQEYVMRVGNAGIGSQSDLIDPEQRQSVREFRLPANEDGLRKIREILMKFETLPSDEEAKKIAEKGKEGQDVFNEWQQFFTDQFYGAFEGCTEIVDHRIAARPSQEIGNCPWRSQLDLLVHVLQLNGEHDVANQLQDEAAKLGTDTRNMYPAFKKLVEYSQDIALPKVEAVSKAPVLEMMVRGVKHKFAMDSEDSIQEGFKKLGYMKEVNIEKAKDGKSYTFEIEEPKTGVSKPELLNGLKKLSGDDQFIANLIRQYNQKTKIDLGAGLAKDAPPAETKELYLLKDGKEVKIEVGKPYTLDKNTQFILK